jgi:hypothetical protein
MRPRSFWLRWRRTAAGIGGSCLLLAGFIGWSASRDDPGSTQTFFAPEDAFTADVPPAPSGSNDARSFGITSVSGSRAAGPGAEVAAASQPPPAVSLVAGPTPPSPAVPDLLAPLPPPFSLVRGPGSAAVQTGVPSLLTPVAQPETPPLLAAPLPAPPAPGPAPTTAPPPVTEPPVTEPPVTEPPVTEPPVTEPPVTEPPAPEPTTAPPEAPVEPSFPPFDPLGGLPSWLAGGGLMGGFGLR